MKKSFLFGLAAVLAAVWPGPGAWGADEVIPSVWANVPARIDGVAEDWSETNFTVWSKGDVDYAFRNDADNLYILFAFKNPKYRSTVEQLGMNIYVNTEGKKNKDYGILFMKKQMSADEAIAYLERENPMPEETKAQMRTKPAYNVYYTQVTNKDAKSKTIPPGVQPKPALFKYVASQQTMVYEFSIPLSRIHELAAGLNAEPGKTLIIGFEWGGPTEAQRKQAARAAGNAGIANEQITRGSDIESMGGAGGGGRVPPKYSFWSEIKLAVKTE